MHRSVLLSMLAALLIATGPAFATLAAPAGPRSDVGSVSLKDRTVALTLQDAVYLGLRQNRSIKSSYISRIAQAFDLRVSEDRFTPKVTISARHIAGHSDDDHYRQSELIPDTELLTPIGTRFSLAWNSQLYQGRDLGRSGNDGATFSIIQPLLKDAGYEVNMAPVRLARMQEEINKLALKTTVSTTITSIITAYRALLSAQEQVRIAEEGVSRAKGLLATNLSLIKAGRMAEFESVQTEADIATQELSVEEARNQLDTNRLALLQLLSLDLRTDIRASDTLAAAPFSISPDQALSKAQENEPTYLTQLLNIKLAQTNLVVAKNQRLWDVSLVAGASQDRIISTADTVTSTDRKWDTYAGVQVEIPIGDLSLRQAEVRARTDLDNQELQAQEAGQTLEKNIISNLQTIQTRWRQVQISQRGKDLTARKLDIERKKLNAGRSSNFEVISYEADLRNAESTHLNAIIAYLDAQTQLDLALGTTLESWDISLNDR
ncbi:TolC family protein [Pseudomonas silvicola]|nr:TolC family protein [Pseudomonas silvicola]